ncbi:MAG: hypothetical protein IJT87_01775 [Ruminiclostridium sp.]|nr:hypothetical protein [Ruminiclostridium sp.]
MGFSSTLTNAAVKIAEKLRSEKATLVIQGDSTEQVPVQFNPSEYRITSRSEYSQKARRKKDEPVVSFNGNKLSTLNVKLYFDCDEVTSLSSVAGAVKGLITGESDEKDITKTIDKITSLTRISGDNHMPPGVVFVWGSLMFSGYADNVAVTYTMFDKKGKPLRAIVDLTISGMNGASDERSSPFNSPDRTKARTLTEDSSIWSIAGKEYGDAREWRRIADANGIMNPLEIPVGTVLSVPAIR